MKYYLDTEFHEYEKNGTPTIDLISIGIVAENGSHYYAICKEFDLDAVWKNEWLFNNVLLPIGNELNDIHYFNDEPSKAVVLGNKEEYRKLLKELGKTREQIKEEILKFTACQGCEWEKCANLEGLSECKTKHEFYAYYADYDWVVFCWLFGRMIDLPKHYPMYCKDLKQMLDACIDENSLSKVRKGNNSKVTFEDVLNNLKNDPNYPKQENEHNALADAKWNRRLHQFILNL